MRPALRFVSFQPLGFAQLLRKGVLRLRAGRSLAHCLPGEDRDAKKEPTGRQRYKKYGSKDPPLQEGATFRLLPGIFDVVPQQADPSPAFAESATGFGMTVGVGAA